jgi:hypothetical protein
MTLEVRTVVPLDTALLVIYADIAFDVENGPYVEFWEVMEYQEGIKRNYLKTYNLGNLCYNDFLTVAEELTRLCERAIVNEAMYAELHNMHINRYN